MARSGSKRRFDLNVLDELVTEMEGLKKALPIGQVKEVRRLIFEVLGAAMVVDGDREQVEKAILALCWEAHKKASRKRKGASSEKVVGENFSRLVKKS